MMMKKEEGKRIDIDTATKLRNTDIDSTMNRIEIYIENCTPEKKIERVDFHDVQVKFDRDNCNLK